MIADNDLFISFVKYLPGIAFVKEGGGRYLFINEKAVEVFGSEVAAWQGKTDDEVWPERLAERLEANDRIVLREGRPMEFVEVLESGGEPLFGLVNKFPLALAKSGKKGVGGSGH